MRVVWVLVFVKVSGFERDLEEPIYSTPQPNVLAWNSGIEKLLLHIIMQYKYNINIWKKGEKHIITTQFKNQDWPVLCLLVHALTFEFELHACYNIYSLL